VGQSSGDGANQSDVCGEDGVAVVVMQDLGHHVVISGRKITRGGER
jgi:hypothetical protein